MPHSLHVSNSKVTGMIGLSWVPHATLEMFFGCSRRLPILPTRSLRTWQFSNPTTPKPRLVVACQVDHSRLISGNTPTKTREPLPLAPCNLARPPLRGFGTRNVPSICRLAGSNASDVRMRLTRRDSRLSNQVVIKCHMQRLGSTDTTVRKTPCSVVPDANGLRIWYVSSVTWCHASYTAQGKARCLES